MKSRRWTARRHQGRRSQQAACVGRSTLESQAEGHPAESGRGRGSTCHSVAGMRYAQSSILRFAPIARQCTGGNDGVRTWGLALSRDGTRLYTANGPRLLCFRWSTPRRLEEIARQIPTGKMPWGLALDD